ncbi:MAG: N-acetylmuramoyl-L-alanine amidase family protein, partial [Beijerinckiaceae bacterium]
RTDRERFQKAAQSIRMREPATTAAVPALPNPADKRPVVVIDPGHGGVDPGAMAKGGIAEKQVVFDVARLVRDRLVANGRLRVQMTRDKDVFVSLGDRVSLARKHNADLFVSLHADMLSGHQGVRGASIYTGSEKATDAEAARLAESENKADAAAGVDQDDEVKTDVADILSDLTRRETRAFSHRFARTLGARMGEAVPMHKKPLREAGFKVLRAPDVPSALIELGYLSNASDSEFLLSSDGQAKAADAIAKAIEAYFERRAQP